MTVLPTIYPLTLLRRVADVAAGSPRTEFLLCHSARCAPPKLTFPNVKVIPSDLVGDGRLLLIDRTEEMEERMRVITQVTFHDDGAVVEFVDTELSSDEGPQLMTAVAIPGDDHFGPDLAELSNQAGEILTDAIAQIQARLAEGDDELDGAL